MGSQQATETSNSDKLFIGINIGDLKYPSTWFQCFCAICGCGDNLRIGTAKAVARLMSFSQITCVICPMLCYSNGTNNYSDLPHLMVA